jgi:hypothetical protein
MPAPLSTKSRLRVAIHKFRAFVMKPPDWTLAITVESE